MQSTRAYDILTAQEARRRYLSHEMAHISGDHLYDDRPVEELEMEADKAGVIPLFRISA